MDELDYKILKLIQDNVPITERPFLELSKILNVSEEELIRRIEKLEREKYIFRIAAKPNFPKFKRVSALVALKVENDSIENVAAYINNISEISHSYMRDNEYNLWITVSARTQDKFDLIINNLKSVSGVIDLIMFPAKNIFKLEVKFEV